MGKTKRLSSGTVGRLNPGRWYCFVFFRADGVRLNTNVWGACGTLLCEGGIAITTARTVLPYSDCRGCCYMLWMDVCCGGEITQAIYLISGREDHARNGYLARCQMLRWFKVWEMARLGILSHRAMTRIP